MNLIVAGNPGVGKSTILNGLLGEARFKSGVVLDRVGGLTTVLQRETDDNGNVLCDTPGLLTLEKREEAAAEILKALKCAPTGRFKLVFVIEDNYGRLRNEDVITIKIIIDALPHGVAYGIIVNSIDPATFLQYKDKHNYEILLTKINHTCNNKTAHVHLNERDDKLAGQNDCIPATSPALIEFLDRIPSANVEAEAIKDLDIAGYDEKKQEAMRIEMDKILHDIMCLREEMDRTCDKQNAQMKQVEELRRVQQQKQWRQARDPPNSDLKVLEVVLAACAGVVLTIAARRQVSKNEYM
eukprot:CAMPEP_0197237920 /NCGR_PEP_ID=MMETSP1429-20130617/4604_1 /TAXON_ID=49237 /ORGANISM="Chaetoceros  sp., Strain UNC1202" /LENGTH=297 /DNA_ID=CAMNT_0042697003 /DNA_START=89 /DNA_END=982 /DNA_ORIENTATION=-